MTSEDLTGNERKSVCRNHSRHMPSNSNRRFSAEKLVCRFNDVLKSFTVGQFLYGHLTMPLDCPHNPDCRERNFLYRYKRRENEHAKPFVVINLLLVLLINIPLIDLVVHRWAADDGLPLIYDSLTELLRSAVPWESMIGTELG